jgi:thiol-disulfide isomerase/thioredoxin
VALHLAVRKAILIVFGTALTIFAKEIRLAQATEISQVARQQHIIQAAPAAMLQVRTGMYLADKGDIMLQLTEESVKDFIQGDRVLVKVWAKNCPYCDKLDDSFAKVELASLQAGALEVSHPMDKTPQPSEFKRTWMRQDKSDVIKDTVPALFIFEKGELKQRHFGMLYPDALQHWLNTGEVIPSKLQQEEKAANEKKQKLFNLFAQRGELTYNIDLINAKLMEVNKQIAEVSR